MMTHLAEDSNTSHSQPATSTARLTSFGRKFAALFTIALACPAADFDLSKTLKGAEERYNHAKSLQVAFDQTYSVSGRGRRTESGVLFLKKPGRMRWEYASPAGKLFLSDSKDIWFYSPDQNRVEKMKLKEADDMRAPLAFLLGKLEFSRDFKEYHMTPKDGQTWVTAIPKSDKLLYKQVEFLFSSDFQIKRLKVLGQDQSLMEFSFAEEKLNPALADKLFQFKMPPGAELVEPAPGQQQ
jgi:outer membrane lipoprotein carrier protein